MAQLQRISGDRALISTMEACKISAFSPTYIQRLLRDERLEGVKVGSIWLVYEDSLSTFMAQPRKRGPKGPHKKSTQDQLDTRPSNEKHDEHAEGTHGSNEGQKTK